MRKSTKKRKIKAVVVLMLSVTNTVITALAMDWYFGFASAAPEWLKTLSIIYVMIPMGYAFSLIVNTFVAGEKEKG